MSQPRSRSGRGPGRATWQRTAVRAALERNDGFVSAQELHHQMRRGGGDPVGLTTVYRQLHLLAEWGDADVVPSPDGSLYRLCRNDDHHHHLIDRTCGRTVEVDGPDLERRVDEIGAEHGFSDLDHVIEFFGTCPACTDASCEDSA